MNKNIEGFVPLENKQFEEGWYIPLKSFIPCPFFDSAPRGGITLWNPKKKKLIISNGKYFDDHDTFVFSAETADDVRLILSRLIAIRG